MKISELSSFVSLPTVIALLSIACLIVISLLVTVVIQRRRRMLYFMALENLPQGLLMFDRDERIAIVNRSLLEMYNLPPEIVKPGCHFTDYLEQRAATGLLKRDLHEYRAEIIARVKERCVYTTTGMTADGRTVAIVERGLEGGGWVVTHEDISDRVELETKLAYQARHDALTNLPNRLLLCERVQQALAGRRADDRHWALLMLDLDRFKEINDTLGHSTGDSLLKEVADRLTASVREGDIVARLGGDEFVIFQCLRHDDFEAEAMARKVIDIISQPFDIKGHHCRIGVSIGIAVAPRDADDLEHLLKHADLALYQSKAEGRGVYHFFEKSLDDLAQSRRKIEIGLREAIACAEFQIYFQPQYKLSSGTICSFEALLRWNKPGSGMVPPSDFIPVAEETGLIVEIGEWVLTTACCEAIKWPSDIGVAVNVSPAQFKDRNFVQSVVNALQSSRLAPERLELEITESVVLEDNIRVLEAFMRIRELGVKLALDDFGTGYSSLTTLRKYPFEKIKIDRSFVEGLGGEGNTEDIIRSVAGLGLSLGLVTTAEGVENQEQLDRVRDIGCDEIQGYLMARPRPASEIPELLRAVDHRSEDAA